MKYCIAGHPRAGRLRKPRNAEKFSLINQKTKTGGGVALADAEGIVRRRPPRGYRRKICIIVQDLAKTYNLMKFHTLCLFI